MPALSGRRWRQVSFLPSSAKRTKQQITASKPFCSSVTYDLVRWADSQKGFSLFFICLVRLANKLCQRPSAPKSRTFCTLGFVSDGRFLVLHLKQTVLQQNLYNCVKSTPQFQIAECFFGFNNSVSGAGVPPDFHQADNLAQLWQEFLSLLELIAQILCAVVDARANAVVAIVKRFLFLFRGFPRRFTSRNDIGRLP